MDQGFSQEQLKEDFAGGRRGQISFNYQGVREDLCYMPVEGTNWMLTILIRDNVISEQIRSISLAMMRRGVIQIVITVTVTIAIFSGLIYHSKRNARMVLEQEKADGNRIRAAYRQIEREQTAMENIHAAMGSGQWSMEFDRDARMVSCTWSDKFREMLGYKNQEDFPDKLESWSALLHEEDKDQVLKEYWDTVMDYTNEKTYGVEYRLLTKNAGWRWFHAAGRLSRREDGSPIVFVGLFVDIDDEKHKIEITLSIDKKVSLNSASDSKEVRPLNIYISGSDSRSNTIYNKSRSDVNIILTINPYTKTILQTAIPRDYYVEVSGTKGLKDKLTHAGIYGVEASKRTIENLLDIEIDYTVKVNFNAVTELVDLIGGIEVYSDTDFNSSHISGWHITKGWNKMDGAKALAYSRERYAYTSGDRHRIKNQQQVLEAIINGVINDKSLLLKYNDLLNTLSSLYRTDINKDLITNFIKDQLDTKASWNFESITIDGKGAMLPTFTAPKNKRYVMIPNEEDIISAHEKINEIYNAK